MNYAPPALVAAAPRPPLPYGLFSVLAPREGTGGRFENGILFESVGCPPASGVIEYQCENTEGLPKEFDSHAGASEWAAFAVYTSHACSPLGNTLGRAEEIARERLALFEERLVEAHLEAFLVDAAISFTMEGDEAKEAVLAGFAGLEAEAALAYGTLGVVHLSRALASYALGMGALTVRSGRLFTALGTPVVAGAGYTLSQVTWTPQLVGYRGEVFTSSNREGDLLDRSSNDLYGVAERQWVIGFDTSCDVYVAPETP